MKSVAKLPSRYKIERKLGEGGFGEVYKAYDSHLKQTLAIKILPDTATSTQETLTREFKTLSQLQHPNLVRVFDYGILPPHVPYFTMELVEGRNLREFFTNKASIHLVPAVIKQILKALTYLNRNRILHGDIKPENIVITEGEDRSINTKLLDFGLTMGLGDERKLMSGTLRYLAPEILLHGSRNSPATDLYALGISLIESILSTEVPGSNEIDETFFENTYAALNTTLASVGIRNPSALSSFILDLCRMDPSDRLQDTREATRAFEMIADELAPRQEIQLNSIFVGRTDELREIERYTADPSAAKRVVILSGPRGIGKKSIMRKAAQRAQLRGSLPIDLTPSSSFFSLDEFVDALGSNLSPAEKRRFVSRLPARGKPDSKNEGNNLDPNGASVIYAHIIQFLVEMSASRPILIMASDIDRSSVDFYSFIVQMIKQMEVSESRINLLITSSIDFANRSGLLEELSRIARSPIAAFIEVRPFDDKLLKRYLIECFGQPLLPERERRDLLSKTQGIPLLIAAFLRSLLTSAVIQIEEGHWILDRRLYKQKQIPTDIDDSFSIAMKGVSENEETLLRMLAIYGQALQPHLLIKVSRRLIEDPLRALTGAMEKTILIYRGDGAVSFAHPFYGQFVIENTPDDIIRDYSKVLADWLASEGSSDSLRMAQLYASAEMVDDALNHGFHAVEGMYSSYLLYDCLKLLLDLKDLALRRGNESQILAVLERLAPVEHRTGLPKEAIEDYCILVNSTHSDAQKAHYSMELAEIHFRLLGNTEESRAMYQKALRSANRAGDSNLIASAYHGLASMTPEKSILFYEKAAMLSKRTNINLYLTSLAHLVNKYQLAGELRRASMIQETITKEIDKTDLWARKEIYFFLYWVKFLTADYKSARFYIMKKIQIERRTEDSPDLATSMSDLGGCLYTEGSFYKMIDTLKEAYRIAMKYGKYLSAITVLSNLSLAYRTVADYGLSMKMLLQAEDLSKREGIQALNSAFLNKPTMLYVMLGKAKEPGFKASAKRLHERARKTNNRIGSGHHSMAFAMYHMNKLQPDEALIHAKKALSLFKQAGDRDDVVSALVHIGIIQTSLGKPKQARTNLEQAEKIYEAIHCEYLKPLLMLGKAMLARFESSDDAKKILTDALRTSKKMGTREITWQVQREFALHYKDRGEPHKALSHYRDAVETIKQITETIDEEELKMSYLAVPFRKRVFDEIKTLRHQ
ncbi:MAG: protein kinase [Candidatus Krumholzibacteriaceae bacterium]|jgi:serine/threonine protein kinase/tetratricopeptide (TPR) repeat protein